MFTYSISFLKKVKRPRGKYGTGNPAKLQLQKFCKVDLVGLCWVSFVFFSLYDLLFRYIGQLIVLNGVQLFCIGSRS